MLSGLSSPSLTGREGIRPLHWTRSSCELAQEGASGSGRTRLHADRARDPREQPSGSRTQQVAVELDSPGRPGISLSVSGPPGGEASPPQMDTPFQSMVSACLRHTHHSILYIQPVAYAVLSVPMLPWVMVCSLNSHQC